MDDEILKTVHSIFGKGVKIVDCEKTSSVQQEEVLLINGVPVQLDALACDDANAIKAALLIGEMPSLELLNQLLLQAGLYRQPVQLETSLSVKSSMVTTEEVSVSRNGRVMDEHTTKTKEDFTFQSNEKELLQPRLRHKDNSHDSKVKVDACCSSRQSNRREHRESFEIPCSLKEAEVLTENCENTDKSDEGHIFNSGTASSLALSTCPIELSSASISAASSWLAASIETPNESVKLKNVFRKSSQSFDSGHDDIFFSVSHRAANSLSSCYDLLTSSSCDEANEGGLQIGDVTNNAAETKTTTQNNVIHQHKTASVFPQHVEQTALSVNHQMLPMSNKDCSSSSSSIGVSNGSAASVDNTKNGKTTCSKTTHSGISINSSSPATSTTHSREHSNVVSNQKKRYQYIKPQTLLTELHTQQLEVDELTQKDLLVYFDGQLVSGSLEALIEHIVPTCQYYPTSTYVFSFLLSARLFIRPHELLGKISAKWEQEQQQSPGMSNDVVDDGQMAKKSLHSNVSASSISPVILGCSAAIIATGSQKTQQEDQLNMQLSAQNCIRLLAEWIDTFPYDFRDERLMQQVRILARKCVYIDNALGKQVSRILQLLVQRLMVLEKYEEFLQSLTEAELHSNNYESLQQQPLSSTIATTAIHNPLGRGAKTTQITDSKPSLITGSSSNIQPTLRSSLSTGIGAISSSHAHPIESQQLHYSYFQQQNNPSFSDNATTSVSQTLHQLSGHFSNTNSSSSIFDVSGIMDLCLSSAQLAHQLTAIELDRLSHIGPEEFVQAFAKEYQHTLGGQTAVDDTNVEGCGCAAVMNTSINDIKKTRNLESYVQWFNRLSYFTATEIVKYPKKKQRVRIIEYWIETARECFNIGNFNSLMAIIAGLNLAPISRLKKTWSKVQSAKFSVLEHQMDPTSNFNSYRSTLKAAMWRSEGATDERERIIIPFFSLFVKDLYFLNEGCSNRLPNNHINFEKCLQLSKQVMEFNEWKKVKCPFEKLPNVIMFLQSSAILNENSLSIASFECEPPENTQEKGRYKTLKSETKQQLQQQLQEQQLQ